MQLLTSAGPFLASGSAHAGPSIPMGHDDTAYADDVRAHEYEVLTRSLPRQVDGTITDDGPPLSEIQANRSERLELVVTRQTEWMCRKLPLGKLVAIAIVTQEHQHGLELWNLPPAVRLADSRRAR